MKICPHCRHQNREGYMFCEDCGEDLTNIDSFHPVDYTTPTIQEQAIRLLIPNVPEPVVLKLEARNILGRRDPDRPRQPDIDLTSYQAMEYGVSALHAVIQHTNEGVQIVDLDSTNGTTVNGRRLVPNQLYVLHDGDEIRFSRLTARIQILGID
ncbi:MAG: FHA domain-containing protein [Anaerolineae bacterium]|nr:FHA domain-containing protein [Anaerolineae bacterium]